MCALKPSVVLCILGIVGTGRVYAQSKLLDHLHHHREQANACATCKAEPSTTKTTDYNYESRLKVICVPRTRCSCFRCLVHVHGHHADCNPEMIPVVKRVLVKHKVTTETPETRYEGELSPRPTPPVTHPSLHAR